jgi:hypothetical protein
MLPTLSENHLLNVMHRFLPTVSSNKGKIKIVSFYCEWQRIQKTGINDFVQTSALIVACND